jgi:hypothetical protein
MRYRHPTGPREIPRLGSVITGNHMNSERKLAVSSPAMLVGRLRAGSWQSFGGRPRRVRVTSTPAVGALPEPKSPAVGDVPASESKALPSADELHAVGQKELSGAARSDWVPQFLAGA